jgi:hypothetical protein
MQVGACCLIERGHARCMDAADLWRGVFRLAQRSLITPTDLMCSILFDEQDSFYDVCVEVVHLRSDTAFKLRKGRGFNQCRRKGLGLAFWRSCHVHIWSSFTPNVATCGARRAYKLDHVWCLADGNQFVRRGQEKLPGKAETEIKSIST